MTGSDVDSKTEAKVILPSLGPSISGEAIRDVIIHTTQNADMFTKQGNRQQQRLPLHSAHACHSVRISIAHSTSVAHAAGMSMAEIALQTREHEIADSLCLCNWAVFVRDEQCLQTNNLLAELCNLGRESIIV